MQLVKNNRVYPIIKTLELKMGFGYLWLKYLKDVNLDNHCARGLIGPYSKKVSIYQQDEPQTLWKNVLLNEAEVDFYYLCGVTKPYRWKNNLHVAFRMVEGETLAVSEPSADVVIENAVRIPIEEIDFEVCTSEHKHQREYYTCRNWQFSNMWYDLNLKYANIRRRQFERKYLNNTDLKPKGQQSKLL